MAHTVDKVWLQDDAAARALGEAWQALAESPALAPLMAPLMAPLLAPLLAPQSCVVLLAHERVLHAGKAASV